MRAPLSILTLALLLPALAALIGPRPLASASVGECDSDGHLALGVVSIAGWFYIDDRNYVFGNGIWVYEESNGLSWLQRGGGSSWPPEDREFCIDDPDVLPDHLIF